MNDLTAEEPCHKLTLAETFERPNFANIPGVYAILGERNRRWPPGQPPRHTACTGLVSVLSDFAPNWLFGVGYDTVAKLAKITFTPVRNEVDLASDFLLILPYSSHVATTSWLTVSFGDAGRRAG